MIDPQVSAAIAQLQQQVAALSGALRNVSRDSAFAPSSNDPYVVPGSRDFYSYSLIFPTANLGAGASPVGTIGIEADSYFYWNALSYTADIAGAALTESTNVIPLVTITILDTGSGRQLMNSAPPLPSIAGDGKRPYRLPKPRRFAPTAQIVVTLFNYSAATAYDLRLTFHGFKVYATQAITVNGPVGTSG